jgi:hypothetical protein
MMYTRIRGCLAAPESTRASTAVHRKSAGRPDGMYALRRNDVRTHAQAYPTQLHRRWTHLHQTPPKQDTTSQQRCSSGGLGALERGQLRLRRADDSIPSTTCETDNTCELLVKTTTAERTTAASTTSRYYATVSTCATSSTQGHSTRPGWCLLQSQQTQTSWLWHRAW